MRESQRDRRLRSFAARVGQDSGRLRSLRPAQHTPVGITERTSAPPDSTLSEVCSFSVAIDTRSGTGPACLITRRRRCYCGGRSRRNLPVQQEALARREIADTNRVRRTGVDENPGTRRAAEEKGLRQGPMALQPRTVRGRRARQRPVCLADPRNIP